MTPLGVQDRLVDSVKVVHGISDGCFPLVGQPVAAVQVAFTDPFGIPLGALPFVNGERVEASYRLQPDDTLEFVFPCGVKGALDPDERAQLDRIEAAVARLLGERSHSPSRPADKASPGRKTETFEIAEYANELRLQGKTWKEVLAACKKRWQNDRRVRNARQIRATWDRHFGGGRKAH